MRRAFWLVFAFFLCVYGLTNRGAVWSTDAAMRIGQTEYLLDHGAAGYPEDCQQVSEFMGGQMIWGMGQPLTLIPAVLASRAAVAILRPVTSERAYHIKRLVRELGATATNAVIGALTCAGLFAFGLALGFSARACLLATLPFGLGTIWWPYTQDARYEILQGCVALAAFYWLWQYLQTARTHYAALSGAATGFAIITKVSNVALLPALALMWLLALRLRPTPVCRRSLAPALVAFAIPLLCSAAVHFWTDWSFSGVLSLNPFAKYPHVRWGLQMSLAEGVAQLLVMLDWGLLWYSPASFAALLCLPLLGRRHPALAWGIFGYFVVTLLGVAKHVHSMGPVWGPRHLVPTLVPLSLAFLPWAERALAPLAGRLRAATLAALGLAVGLQLVATTVQDSRFHFDRKTLGAEESGALINRFPLLHRFVELAAVARTAWTRAPQTTLSALQPQSPASSDELPPSLRTFNYWWALAHQRGTPWPPLLVVLVGLTLGAALAIRAALAAAGDTLQPLNSTRHDDWAPG